MNAEKQQELFEAIHRSIVDLRIKFLDDKPNDRELDRQLFMLIDTIWKRQSAVLGIKG